MKIYSKKNIDISNSDVIIREATPQDGEHVYQIHIKSIEYFCSDYYTPEAISAWISSKNPDTYKNLPHEVILIVAEKNEMIFGFAFLNLKSKSIDSLYLLPHFEGKGYGRAILFHLEEIARNLEIHELNLSSTLNAVEFYRHMGYEGTTKSVFKLKSGIDLECIKMSKIISSLS